MPNFIIIQLLRHATVFVIAIFNLLLMPELRKKNIHKYSFLLQSELNLYLTKSLANASVMFNFLSRNM